MPISLWKLIPGDIGTVLYWYLVNFRAELRKFPCEWQGWDGTGLGAMRTCGNTSIFYHQRYTSITSNFLHMRVFCLPIRVSDAKYLLFLRFCLWNLRVTKLGLLNNIIRCGLNGFSSRELLYNFSLLPFWFCHRGSLAKGLDREVDVPLSDEIGWLKISVFVQFDFVPWVNLCDILFPRMRIRFLSTVHIHSFLEQRIT